MRRFYFNMIEIILAIAIISIGISSVMVLFTSGIRTSNSTVGNSKLPDVAETIISNVRAVASSHCNANGWNASFDTAFPSLNANGWVGTSTNPGEPGVKDSDFTYDGSKEKDGGILISAGNGNFLYRQLRHTQYGGANNLYETVFSAIAEVRRVSDPGNSYNTNSDVLMSHPILHSTVFPQGDVRNQLNDSYDVAADTSTNALRKFRKILEIRISYPAELAPELRDSKIYRIELYNDKYDGLLPPQFVAAP